MLTTKPTPEMVREWKRIYDEYHDSLKPNRKSGKDVNDYFCRKYSPEEFDSLSFCDVVEFNIMENEPMREKLPKGTEPKIMTYRIKEDSIIVGIDLVTGFFHIEGEDIDRVAEIYDDLFMYRGLDEMDLKNCFLVAEYVKGLGKEKA